MKWTLVEAAGFVAGVLALPFFVVAGWSVCWQLGVCLIGVSLLLVAVLLVVVANLNSPVEVET